MSWGRKSLAERHRNYAANENQEAQHHQGEKAALNVIHAFHRSSPKPRSIKTWLGKSGKNLASIGNPRASLAVCGLRDTLVAFGEIMKPSAVLGRLRRGKCHVYSAYRRFTTASPPLARPHTPSRRTKGSCDRDRAELAATAPRHCVRPSFEPPARLYLVQVARCKASAELRDRPLLTIRLPEMAKGRGKLCLLTAS
jgi:hypothetical protein